MGSCLALARVCICLAATLGALRAAADSATVAVAANFVPPLEELEKAFERRGEHELTIVSGSTVQLYTQVVNGAPFDVFLSADGEHVDMLVRAKLADGATRFTYAIGKLALFTRDTDKLAPLTLDTLRRTDYRWLAIGNPELAPYGLAAQQTLTKLGLWNALQPRIVRGENIAQTFTMAETRNADLAFVSLSQAIAYTGAASRLVVVPAELYDPIRQDAVLLARGSGNAAARAFLAFLTSADAVAVIERFGYAAPGAAHGP
ncbi:MAG TPA: molybdate ABC transporter substrate-binding protein [Gammaproteobacteria bacterium]|nr:molybdate ABC transporter substrate-binding protein [Gammaproteobacteria bacterium]